jgi:hypothetical protein
MNRIRQWLPKPSPFERAAGMIANAVLALRRADTKLAMAITSYDPSAAIAAFRELDPKYDAADIGVGYIEMRELLYARYGARLFADALDNGAEPTGRAHLLAGIAEHVNANCSNSPHVEGAIIALTLAERFLDLSLEIGQQMDATDVADEWRNVYAALGFARTNVLLLTSGAFPFEIDTAIKWLRKRPQKRLDVERERVLLACCR